MIIALIGFHIKYVRLITAYLKQYIKTKSCAQSRDKLNIDGLNYTVTFNCKANLD